jgi:hypothetical protein
MHPIYNWEVIKVSVSTYNCDAHLAHSAAMIGAFHPAIKVAHDCRNAQYSADAVAVFGS